MSGRSLRALACAMAGCSVWYVAIVCALFVGQAGAQGSTAANAGSGLYYTADDGFAMLHQRGGRKPYKEKEDSNDRGGRKPYKKKEDNNDVNRDCIELNEMFGWTATCRRMAVPPGSDAWARKQAASVNKYGIECIATVTR